MRHLGIVDLAARLGFRRAHLAAPAYPAAPRTRRPGPGARLLDRTGWSSPPRGPTRRSTCAASRRTTPRTWATPRPTSRSTSLGRAWRDAGHRVRYASNVTDVDDPLLERATATGVDWRDLAAEQTALYAEDMAALRRHPARRTTPAWSRSIPAVVEAVETLLAAGAAYRVPTDARRRRSATSTRTSRPTSTSATRRRARRRPPCARCPPSAAATPTGPASATPLDPLLWRRERAGEPVVGRRLARPRPAGLAHRVRGHRAATPSGCRSTSRAAGPTCSSRTTR